MILFSSINDESLYSLQKLPFYQFHEFQLTFNNALLSILQNYDLATNVI